MSFLLHDISLAELVDVGLDAPRPIIYCAVDVLRLKSLDSSHVEVLARGAAPAPSFLQRIELKIFQKLKKS